MQGGDNFTVHATSFTRETAGQKRSPKRINWGLKRHHAMNSWTIGQTIFQNCLGSSIYICEKCYHQCLLRKKPEKS